MKGIGKIVTTASHKDIFCTNIQNAMTPKKIASTNNITPRPRETRKDVTSFVINAITFPGPCSS